MKSNHTLIVTGGGSGGHVFPGVAIADEWKRRYPESRILFVGARGAIEEKLVPRAGYPLALIELGSLKRVSMGRRLKTLVQIPLALFKASRILFRERPDAVIGIGGYASGPIVLTARLLGWLWKTRVSIIEQNAIPGFTNRILGSFAQRIYCAFPGIEKQFAPGKALITGNPIRKEMLPTAAAPRDPFQIFIFGGSQGAVGINTLILEALPHLKDLLHRIRIVHQTGEADYDRVIEGYRKQGFPAQVEKFIYQMKPVYDGSSLLICRAGANTFAEIAALGRAVILIPLPTSADDHQAKNALLFQNAGAALVLNQRTSSGSDLAHQIRDLMNQPEKVTELENAVRSFHRDGAASRIVSDLVRE